MKILAASDLHYSLPQFDWVGENLGRFDLLVLAGDLLDLASPVDLDVQEVVVSRYLRKFSSQRPVATSSGNHDIGEPEREGERVALWMERMKGATLRPDYTCIEKSGVVISVCPWWDGPASKERTEARLEEDSQKEKRVWIWLHHHPPQGTGVAWTGKADGGDAQVREWIAKYQPDFVFAGHIHYAPFYEKGGWGSRIGKTWIFNAGRQPGGEPTRIVLDLAAGRAEWISAEGVEMVETDGPD